MLPSNLVQLAKAFSIIANGGYDVEPKLVYEGQKTTIQSDQLNEKRLYSAESVNEMKNILKGTVEKGTARRAVVKGYNIMGKTGTANMIVDGTYSYIHNVYTFSGFIEKDNYRRVIVTFVKDLALKNIYASTTAAPLFNKVAEKTS